MSAGAPAAGETSPAVGAAGGPPGDAEVAARVWQRMRELVLHRHEQRKQACDALGLSFVRIRALLKLRRGPLAMRELAEALAIDRPYATLVVDELERRGLVSRTVKPDDRRCRLVTLTATGQAAASDADGILGVPPPALVALGPADLATLDRLTAVLDAGTAATAAR